MILVGSSLTGQISGIPTRWKLFCFRGAEKILFRQMSPTRWRFFHFRGAEKILFRQMSPTKRKFYSIRGAENKNVLKFSPTKQKLFNSRGADNKISQNQLHEMDKVRATLDAHSPECAAFGTMRC